MKSKIKFLADYRQAEFPRDVDVRCPEKYYQKHLRVFTGSDKRTEPVCVLKKGDTAVLALISEMPRYNRPMVPVLVGNGLFDPELEAQLIGHAVGEPFAVQVQGTPVTVTVKQATRTVFPELTDEKVAEYAASQEGMENVKTVADFRRWVEAQYREETCREAVITGIRACFDYVLTNSQWELDEEEISQVTEMALDSVRGSKRFENADLQKLEQNYRKWAQRDVATALWMAAVHGVDPTQATLEQINKLDRSFLETYVSSQLNLH